MANRFDPAVQSSVLTDVFNIMPGLVVEVVGLPAVVLDVTRDMDTEKITFTVNTPEGDLTLVRSWARGDTIRLIGLCVSAGLGEGDRDDYLDSLDLFEG